MTIPANIEISALNIPLKQSKLQGKTVHNQARDIKSLMIQQ